MLEGAKIPGPLGQDGGMHFACEKHMDFCGDR